MAKETDLVPSSLFMSVMLSGSMRKWKHHPTSSTTLTVLAQTSVAEAS